MSVGQNKDPLHGVTLKAILERLVETYGWDGLADKIRINCFTNDPSINSSLVFLRKTQWARQKVEQLYLYNIGKSKPNEHKEFQPLHLD